MPRVSGLEIPPEFLSLVWPVFDAPYEPAALGLPGPTWRPNTPINLGQFIIEPSAESTPPGLFYKYICIAPGTTDPTTEPAWPTAGSFTDHTVTWRTGDRVPWSTIVTRKRGARQIEPPHIPTANQTRLRDAFARATRAVAHMTPTQKRAHFRLADKHGQEYWNHTAETWIPEAYWDGGTEDWWLHPRTRVTEPEWADQIPIISLDYPDRFSFRILLIAQIDPGTYRPNSPTRWENCPYYIHDRCDFTPYGYSEYGYTLSPTRPLTYYWTTFLLPEHSSANQFLRRTIVFKKQVQELDRECLVWNFDPLINPERATETLHAFWGPTNPWTP